MEVLPLPQAGRGDPAATRRAMTPELAHVCDIDVDVGPIRDLGPTPRGRRRIIAILGGR